MSGIVERRPRKFRRWTDRPRCQPTPGPRSRCRAPFRATGTCRSLPPECEAAKIRPAGRSGSSKAAFAVRNVLCRMSTIPRLDGPTMRMPVFAAISRSRASRLLAVLAGFAKAVGERRGDRHAEPPAFLDGFDRGLGARDDVDVVRHFGQRRRATASALAQHLVAPRVDRIDAAGVARLPQIFQRPAAGSCLASFDCPTMRDRLRREQNLARLPSGGGGGGYK